MANVNQIIEKQRRAALVTKLVELSPKPTRKQQLRKIVLDILAEREIVTYEPDQFPHLEIGVAEVLQRNLGESPHQYLGSRDPKLNFEDGALLLEIFWDLFREGIITIGKDSANAEFPWFSVHSEAPKF